MKKIRKVNRRFVVNLKVRDNLQDHDTDSSRL